MFWWNLTWQEVYLEIESLRLDFLRGNHLGHLGFNRGFFKNNASLTPSHSHTSAPFSLTLFLHSVYFTFITFADHPLLSLSLFHIILELLKKIEALLFFEIGLCFWVFGFVYICCGIGLCFWVCLYLLRI